ncbi:hypothetical protein QMK19_07180 [Streptomyces sp. H10-C2]|uniref:WXG100 family type VII secretion target n=1 Tax=Streptomyces sp. H10-C2 TaxID=3046210 RepID=UPI0024B9410D|nr:hypothetical protein [Streptomyces sp. H10-C2]MDJ0369460.1 hypothetical protein [Streptomyces sp. H10-C2]
MGAFEEAKEWLVETMGMWWPDGDEGKLRQAATAWRTYADAVGDVRAATNSSAGTLIHHNKGEAIDAFDGFWRRYSGGGKGWLEDQEAAARQMAKALDDLADEIADVKDKIDTQLEISAVVIAAGIGLAFFTAGLAAGAAATAAAAMVDFAASMGMVVGTTAARIAAGALVGVVFGGVESVTVNLAVAQPLQIAAGTQNGFQLDQVDHALTDGMKYGGVFGAGGAGAESFATNVAAAGGYRNSFLGILGRFGVPGAPSPVWNAPFPLLANRGGGTPLPPFDEIKRAVAESKPQIVSGRWPDNDGRYYASRVLAGGRSDGETVLAGHGYIERNAGEITVPPGTTISFYVEHGERIPGLNGVAVEGGSYPAAALETFHPGDRIPNYTLGPPTPSAAGGFTVYENSTTVPGRTPLGDLLKPNMGNVHWAACREFK